jgi:hypothetical protein
MGMVDLLIETLEQMGFPIYQQGSMTENYPPSFFTFWNSESDGDSFYDNDETRTNWNYDLNFYSDDPETIEDNLLEAKGLLKQAGFIVTGKGYDVASDEESHTGRGINVKYIERS